MANNIPWAKPEPCLKQRCRSPIACGGFGYCRERNNNGLPSEFERKCWQLEAEDARRSAQHFHDEHEASK